MFRLHYHIENCGDGSSAARFHASRAQAEKADEEQPEPWAEQTADHVLLDIQEGRIVRKVEHWDAKKKRHVTTWVPLEEV